MEIVSHNREDELAKMLEDGSEGDDDEAKVSQVQSLSSNRQTMAPLKIFPDAGVHQKGQKNLALHFSGN